MNKLHLKEGQTYICTKSDKPWWTRGKEYKGVSTNHGKLYLVDDNGTKWYLNYLKNTACQFKLKETPQKATMEYLKSKDVERKYTPFEVTKVILRAYNMYDNDAQRLAYIKGYFAK
jgi:hypothetical protein|nr:MAG TPA: hypothetical protein [Caudoviricetes sp.]